MKILIDMNLSPRWVSALAEMGIESIHWCDVGDPLAPDRDLMDWARGNGYVVFTHDLDFGALLATAGGRKPSVIQLRTQDVFPEAFAAVLAATIQQFREEIADGALVTIDPDRRRVRLLPISR